MRWDVRDKTEQGRTYWNGVGEPAEERRSGFVERHRAPRSRSALNKNPMGDLLDLDELPLSLVLSYLSNRDLLNVQLTCKALHAYVSREDGFHWRLKLEEEFDVRPRDVSRVVRMREVEVEEEEDGDRDLDLDLERRVVKQVMAYQETYTRLVRAGRSSRSRSERPFRPLPLRFRGLFTNGDVDVIPDDTLNAARYWTDNAFRHDSAPYCSISPTNVDIVGVHLASSHATYRQERRDRKYMKARTRFAMQWLRRVVNGPPFGLSDLSSDQQLQLFFLTLLESFEVGHGLGLTLFVEDREQIVRGGIELEELEVDRLLEEATALRDRVLLAEERLKARLVGGSSATPYPYNPTDGSGANDGVVVDWALAGGLVGVRDADADDADDADVAPLAPCVLERLVISRRGELTCPVRCGWVFGGGLHPATARLSSRLSSAHDVVGLLRVSLARVNVPQFTHALGLDMVLNWAKNGGLSPVERVHLFVVREVDGVHFEGNAFVEFVRGDDRADDDERVWEPVGFFIFGTSWVLGGHGHQPADAKCTFRDVPPGRIVVTLGAYDDDEGARRTTTTSSAGSLSDEMRVDLGKRRLVDAVAVKMIECENKMADDDPHPVPNIDLARFLGYGRRVLVGEEEAGGRGRGHGYNTRYGPVSSSDEESDEEDVDQDDLDDDDFDDRSDDDDDGREEAGNPEDDDDDMA